MIQTVAINTIEQAMTLLMDRQYQVEIDRHRSNYLYRGVPATEYKLKTSLERNCGEKQAFLEHSILNYFTKYGVADDPLIEGSVWRQMIMGQHYSLPTRLLDWSHSSLIALHFATSEVNIEDTDKRDGVVWRIDADEMSRLLPDAYRAVLKRDNTEIFSVNTLNEVVQTTEQYDADMGDSSMVIIEPPSTNQRIVNQYSYFSIVPMGIHDIEAFLDRYTEHTVKFVIDKDVRWELRDLLDELNVSERMIFPGLDGLSRWIARHYYVKKRD